MEACLVAGLMPPVGLPTLVACQVVEWRYRSLDFYHKYLAARMCDRDGNPQGDWKELNPFIQDDAEVSVFADNALIYLKSDWRGFSKGSLLALPLQSLLNDQPEEHDNSAFTVLFKPSERVSMDSWTNTKNYLLVQTLDNVKSRVSYWKYLAPEDTGKPHGSWSYVGAEKDAQIRGASLRAVDDDESDDIFFTTNSFTEPSTLHLTSAAKGPAGLEKAEMETLRTLPHMFNAEGVQVSQGFATSTDGTKVPYFLIQGGRERTSSPAPTLLYGYGGFMIPITVGYSATVGAGWLEQGGTYVIANIRGGGEFGPQWHQAALRENRQKAYDDMIAVAEDLVARGIATPETLAVRGGSNGGLLVGNMMVQRPDLFGAIVCAVPLLDMKRFSHLLAGASWMAEYGDPDSEDWANYLHKYSPYHQLVPSNTPSQTSNKEFKYPPMLMTTSTRDDRVHPYHARSFVKRLQELGDARTPSSLFYYENIEGGHGGAADPGQMAFMTTLYLEFLQKTIGKGKM